MTDLSLLDFSLAPRRLESVRFDLLDEDLNDLGRVHPMGAPSLTIERARQVKRSLSNINLLPPESSRLTFRTRLRPVWVFDDGSEFPLGVFVLSDETQAVGAEDRLEAVVMGDQMTLYRDSLDQSFSVRPGDSILDKLYEVHALATNPAPSVGWGHVTALARSSLVWLPGTPLADVMEELGDVAAVKVWFNNEGQLRFDPMSDDPHVIDLSHHIEGSLKFTYSNEDSPNRWIARGDDSDYSVEGVYELPAAAPHSFVNRGRYVTRQVTVPGLIDQETAIVAARDASYDEEFPYKEMSLKVPARPDLDVYDAVSLENGQVFLLDSVSTDLIAGAVTDVKGQAFWEHPTTISAETKLTFAGSDPIPGDVPPQRATMLWDQEFLAHWRTLSRQQQHQLRAWLDAQAQQRQERLERQAQRRQRQIRRNRRGRSARTGHSVRRPAQVRSYDADTNIATVLLDGDREGSEFPARMETDVPAADQRVMVRFNSPTPVVSGIEGGVQRVFEWVRINANSTQSTLAENEVNGCEVEVSITQPGRLIAIFAQCRVGIASGNPLMFIEGMIQRDSDDGAGAFARIGYFGSQLGVSDLATGETLSGFVFDDSPEPGIYTYRMATQGTDQPYRIMGATATTKMVVLDLGADILAAFS